MVAEEIEEFKPELAIQKPSVKDILVRNTEFVVNIFLQIVGIPLYLLILPVKAFTWIVTKVKTRRYDPEKRVCPGCGFRGDKGTDYKTCSIKIKQTSGIERYSLEHNCFRCSAVHYSPLFTPADKWIAR
jgi:hypothetical protein